MIRQLLFLPLLPVLAAHAAAPDGEALYKQRCATCHEGKAQPRMPSRQELAARTPESIYQAMFGGVMDVASHRLVRERRPRHRALLTGKEFGAGGCDASRENAPPPPARSP